MGYQEPERIYIIVDSNKKPILQVPKEDLAAYLKEKQKREEESKLKPTS